MARTSGRSKGCATCRKRKIRCDEILPECSQCLKGGRKCPGAVSGMVFLEATASRSSSRQRSSFHGSATSQESSKSELCEQDSGLNYAAASLHSATQANPIIIGINEKLLDDAQQTDLELHSEPDANRRNFDQHELSAAQENSELSDLLVWRGEEKILSEQMMSNFIGFFANDLSMDDQERSWLYLLPHMTCSESVPAVKLAVIAVSCMYHGTLTEQKDAIMEGYKWYGSSLEEQRRKLQQSTQEARIPAAEAICMPILLSYFEVICSTSLTAWTHHVVAAAKLLDIRGAERCSSGICYQLFQSVRAQMVYPAITNRTPSIFARSEWLDAPFINRPRASFDKIMDCLTCLPLLQCQIDDDYSPRIFFKRHPGGDPLEMRAKQMKIELDELWKEMVAEASAQGWRGGQFQNQIGFDLDLDTGTETTTVIARAPLGALTVALYNTARILLLSVLSQVASFSQSELQEISAQMTAHSASIIDMAEFLGVHDIGCGILRLMLPLRVVGVSNHNMTHSRHAVQLLERWRPRCGMSGICEVVLSDIQRETSAEIERA